MIPKKIHYCWFGGNPLPELANKCIASWKKYLPDYEIIQWDESNYSAIEKCQYVKEAYQAGKWAFVSDYARFDILYHQGGVYFDTDVELIKSIDDILEQGAFSGTEKAYSLTDASVDGLMVSTGLGLAAEKGMPLLGTVLEHYHQRSFYTKDGDIDTTTVVRIISNILREFPMEPRQDGVIHIHGLNVYPRDYFAPLDYETGELHITDNTRSIHHYLATWKDPKVEKWHGVCQKTIRIYGKEEGARIVNSLPFRLCGTLYMYGFLGTLNRRIKKKTR